ncbi:MAG: 50S ribosomal protein L5 [Candidatus Omnitrophica bacterium]|nr:50S ribosomal protein L5 [Candidatus Omnitrophota bacterium]
MEENKEKYIPRFLNNYRNEIIDQMRQKYNYKNVLAVPRLIKIVVNMGVGQATQDAKIIEKCAEELGVITGQKPKICRSRKPISNFKLKENVPIGCCVTLRRAMMYEFLDRFITVASPRIRDFRGFSANSFDGNGNYTFGLTEQNIFPEINLDKISRTQGMNITIHTSALTDDEARDLLKLFGFPFRR